MGAGLAKQLVNKYPTLYLEYLTAYKENYWKLGEIQLVKIDSKLYIANLAGQHSVSRSKQMTDYLAIETCFERLKTEAEKLNLSIYIPYGIGCGLAGGDWIVVTNLINKVFKDSAVSVFICKI
jgi:hypothetical protein